MSTDTRQDLATTPNAAQGELLPRETAMEAFTFGEPVPVLDSRGILDYVECWSNGRWYEPPLSMAGLAKGMRSSPYVQSALMFKRNMLAKTFVPHRLLSLAAFEQFALDWLTFGNAYLEKRRARLMNTLTLQPPLAKYVRRGVEEGVFFQVLGWKDEHEFEAGSVFQLREADVNQELYGIPEWFCALQSALLNESATLFRRKYYNNGSHAGFILYMTDAAQDQADIDNLRTALKNAKGPGNFRNLFIYAPNGKKEGIQLIPVSEVAAKDDFGAIKNISRDDQLAALRVYPQLLGVVPQNAGGFGSITDATVVWEANELAPLQARLRQVNDWVGEEVMRFRESALPA
ncbi:phage portal protein [Pseudomonas citronellolis]|uniref:phage portal protein n=1 Tax=Pseudomonas citronellolis TaxID=53408 RepID=UPI0020A00E1E|nr:phage portal protein [Pseudomonas citronellolis]MCP1605707.1 PBSX family phage portal protein [Pseudomonas citronellolis]MCP1656139.1 PBSX family phage portal protein [Pseudomonas citronellolis]MCP1722299.1 PBSX family phage portal protein [Pseudomonas citronellolis]MDN6874620.1 phage portal protein [Pseudomonas citronellolis]